MGGWPCVRFGSRALAHSTLTSITPAIGPLFGPLSHLLAALLEVSVKALPALARCMHVLEPAPRHELHRGLRARAATRPHPRDSGPVAHGGHRWGGQGIR